MDRHRELVLFHGIPGTVYPAGHGTIVPCAGGLAYDPDDYQSGHISVAFGGLFLLHETSENTKEYSDFHLCDPAAALFGDFSDSYADGEYLYVACAPDPAGFRHVPASQPAPGGRRMETGTHMGAVYGSQCGLRPVRSALSAGPAGAAVYHGGDLYFKKR